MGPLLRWRLRSYWRGAVLACLLTGTTTTVLAVAAIGQAWPATAWAAQEDAPGDLPSDRIERVVEGLEQSPFFVDPDAVHEFGAEERQQIRAGLAELDLAAFVVALPLTEYDESYGRESLFLQNLHDAMDEPGVYVVVDSRSAFIHITNYGAPIELDQRDLDDAIWSTAGNDLPLGERTTMLVSAIADAPSAGPSTPSGREEPPLWATTPEVEGTPPAALVAIGGGIGAAGGLALFGLFRLIVLIVTVVGRTAGAGHGTFGDDRAPTVLSTRRLQRIADAEVSALRAGLGRGGQDAIAEQAMSYATRCLDAAMLVRAERSAPIDLVGVIVLARLGRLTLLDRARGRVPCYLHPLHPPAARLASPVLQLPDEPTSRAVAVCPTCADRSGRLEAGVLRIQSGEPVPTGGTGGTSGPGNRGPVPYYRITGWWGESWFEATTADLPDHVLERLGVR